MAFILETAIIAVCLILIGSGALGNLWYIAVVGIFATLAVFYLFRLKSQKKELPHIDDTFFMSGAEFENYVADVYKARGYKVQIVGGSGDQGIDIIAKKFWNKIGIQAKCYAKPVSNKAVMEAVAGKKYYGLKKAVVVTNSIFTPSAVKLARKCKVKLIDKKDLAMIVRKINE